MGILDPIAEVVEYEGWAEDQGSCNLHSKSKMWGIGRARECQWYSQVVQ